MKNIIALLLIGLLVIGVGYFVFANSGSETGGNSVTNNGGEYQKVVLSMKDYNYFPNTVTVKANQPVRIYLDDSVQGCYRSFTIKEMGVAKYLKNSDDYVEFTPTKKGTYRFACSMGMGTGTLIVE